MKAIPPEDLPSWAIVRFYVQSTRGADEILRCLGRFNPILDVSSWVVRTFEVGRDGKETRLIVTIPLKEEIALERLNLRPFYGLTQANAKVVRSANHKVQPQQGSVTVESTDASPRDPPGQGEQEAQPLTPATEEVEVMEQEPVP